LAELASFAPPLLTISAIACAMTVAVCACNPAQRDLNAVRHKVRAAAVLTPARTHEDYEPRRYAEFRIRRPDAPLLAPQSAPDCEFKGADVETVDPAELARLKLEYERQCYQNAEKAVHDRLSRLQAQHMRD
jgi:Tfp pilus assembly protein PilP